MQILFRTLLVSFSLFTYLLSSPALATDSQQSKITKIIISSDEWCPYNCSPNTDTPGFMIEITKAAFGHSGVEVVYKPTNWSRVLQLTRTGEIDGALGATADEAHDEGLVYGTEPMALSSFVFVVRKELDWKFQGPESLSKIRFGIVQDYDNGPVIGEYMAFKPKNVIVQVGNSAFEKNIRLVMANRLDAAIDDSIVAAYKLSKMGLTSETKFVALDKEPLAISIAFSPNPKGRSLSKMLDNGIQHIRKTGQLGKILSKYGLKDWK